MRTAAVLVVSCLLVSTGFAQGTPHLNLSTTQIEPGQTVLVHGSGFAPRAVISSHLFRPDGTEYPTMSLQADAKGDLSHVVTIVPPMTGTFELRMIDETSKAVTAARFMMVPPGTPAIPNSQLDQMPSSFSGVWNGMATQKGKDERLRVIATLFGGRVAGLVGTVAYPEQNCGGELWLAAAAQDVIRLGEVITYGADRCSGRALVTIRKGGRGGLELEWRDMLRTGSATAALERRN